MEKILAVLQDRLAECPTRDRALLARRLQGLRRRWRDGKARSRPGRIDR
ncbi:MAG: hypothetical protein U1F42_09355 [Candidatus Competibacteraceae bacterium]